MKKKHFARTTKFSLNLLVCKNIRSGIIALEIEREEICFPQGSFMINEPYICMYAINPTSFIDFHLKQFNLM